MIVSFLEFPALPLGLSSAFMNTNRELEWKACDENPRSINATVARIVGVYW